MSIPAECPDCLRTYQVPDKYEGKSIRCKSCGAAIRVKKPYRDTVDEEITFGPQWTRDETAPAEAKNPATGQNFAKGQIAKRGFWIPLAVCCGILLLMVLGSILSTLAGMFLAFLSLAAGFLALFVGKIVLLVESSREDSKESLLVFFVPFYSFYYQISRWPRTQTSVNIMVLGVLGIAAAPLIFFAGVLGAGGKAPFDNLAQNGVAQNGNQPAQNANQPGGGQPADQQRAAVVRRPNGRPPWANPPGPNFPQPNFAGPADFPNPADLRPDHPRPMGRGPRWVGPRGRFGPSPPGGPFGRPSPDDRQAKPDPVTVTWYLTEYRHGFDPDENHLAEIENELIDMEGYVPGSAKLDLKAGTFTFTYDKSQSRFVDHNASWALQLIGLRGEKERPVEPWVAPGTTRTLTYTIVGVIERRRDRVEGKLGEAADEALTRHGSRYGYVPGSVKIDLEKRQVTFQCQPPIMTEGSVWGSLISVGFRVEKSAKSAH